MCVLRTINAFLELSVTRARADSYVSVEITTCKNSLPNIIAVYTSTRHRDLLSTPIDASRISRNIVLNDIERSNTRIYNSIYRRISVSTFRI